MRSITSFTLKSLAPFLLTTALFFAGGSPVAASDAPLYELYPTHNTFNFLKLNTRTGVVTKVQYDVSDADKRFENLVNGIPLADEDSSENGRFKIYLTTNIYNFLLLDQVTGRVWQLQWTLDPVKYTNGIVGEID